MRSACHPRRSTPAAAKTMASKFWSFILRILVCKFPRKSWISKSGRACKSCALLRKLLVPTFAPSGNAAKEAYRSGQVPIGAYAYLEDDLLQLEGLVGSLDGKTIIRNRISGVPAQCAFWMHSSPFTVINFTSPGPAPIKYTFPLFMNSAPFCCRSGASGMARFDNRRTGLWGLSACCGARCNWCGNSQWWWRNFEAGAACKKKHIVQKLIHQQDCAVSA